jgi:hypothetical protein
MAMKRTLTVTALLTAGARMMSFVPSLNAEAQSRRLARAEKGGEPKIRRLSSYK